MDPIVRMSATELAGRIRTKELGPVEVAEAHIRRVEQVNPALNAVVAERFDKALDESRAAEARLMRTPAAELPPLFGVPCTIKDFYAVEGLPQTGGLWLRKDAIATEDAVVVRRVRDAGAIVLGVTNVPEGGLWLESHNRVYGRSNNPWDLRRTPGGSSGGEGAIVAAGGSAFGMGSDIGGSIRLPAAFCGVAGHKPTGRMVPSTGHWPPLEGALRGYLACGPIARRVDDLIAVWKLVAGPDAAGFTQAWELGDPAAVDLTGVSVFPLHEGGVKVEPALGAALDRSAHLLERRGARIERLRPDLLREAIWVWGAMMSAEEGPSYAELVSGDRDMSVLRELMKLPLGRSRHTGPVLALILGERLMKRFPSKQNQRLLELGRSLGREIEDTLGDRGVILHPPYSRSAPRHGAPLLRPLDPGFTAIFNVLELPATQVPTGLDSRGLPVGVQVVGARGRDHLCLAVAKALEEELGVLTPIDPRPAHHAAAARRG
ncbi:MAG: amidase [Polyangiaceae bacterium]